MEVSSMRTFTTGEVANLCNISVRTVQYYDREGIVKPSELSEGGRRIYTESDLSQFQLVCLYKNLGFSLKEIKDILHSNEEYSMILDLIDQQTHKISDQILEMNKLKDRLSVLHQELSDRKIMPISNDLELNQLLTKRKNHRKSDFFTIIFIIGYCLLLVIGFILSIKLGGITPLIMTGIGILSLIGLIYYHSAKNAYLCPYCHHKFTISFFRDMFSLNGGKRGKLLKCPSCRKRSWMGETHPD